MKIAAAVQLLSVDGDSLRETDFCIIIPKTMSHMHIACWVNFRKCAFSSFSKKHAIIYFPTICYIF